MLILMNADEESILLRALSKHRADPSYQFTELEKTTARIALGRGALACPPLSLLPDKPPGNYDTKTLNSLSPYLQRKMRWLKSKFDETIKGGEKFYVDKELALCGLQGKVSPDVVKRCIVELQVASEMEQELHYLYPHPRAPDEEFDPNCPTIKQQAEMLGLEIVQPELDRSAYCGFLVGRDHHSGLIKCAEKKGLIFPFFAIPEGQIWPLNGEMVRVEFKKGELTVSVAS